VSRQRVELWRPRCPERFCLAASALRFSTADLNSSNFIPSCFSGSIGHSIVPPSRWRALLALCASFRNQSRAAPRDVRRIVGIAGVVTKGLCDPDDDDLDLSEAAAMSPTDWEAVGCDPGEPDRLCFQAFERAKSLLCRGGPLWPKLIKTTREIILCAPPVDFLNEVFPDWKTACRRILQADENPHARWGTQVSFLLEAEPNLVAGLG
jgi:hypothetical protein